MTIFTSFKGESIVLRHYFVFSVLVEQEIAGLHGEYGLVGFTTHVTDSKTEIKSIN